MFVDNRSAKNENVLMSGRSPEGTPGTGASSGVLVRGCDEGVEHRAATLAAQAAAEAFGGIVPEPAIEDRRLVACVAAVTAGIIALFELVGRIRNS